MRTVGARLTIDVSQYMTNLRRAGLATKDFATTLDATAKQGKLDRVADSAVKFGIVGAAAFGYVVKSAADFDKQMSAVSAATHASTADMGALRQAALQAGKDTQYSATQAADGITQMAKAGVSTADILGGGLKGALSLAAAGQLDVGQASEIAATALTQFGLSGAQLPHVADVLAAAAGKAQGSVSDMSVALKYAGLPAHALGISMEETAGTLALFAKNGLIGEQAGTSFRGVLASLTGPSKQASGVMEDLGINVYDASGKFVGMTGVAEQLRTKLGGLSEAQRNAALSTIFGRENLQAAIILMQGGSKAVQDWTKGVNDAGYATDSAAKLTDNLAGDIERLKGSLETLAIESGSGANSGIRILTQGLNSLVDRFAAMPPAVGSTLTVLAGVGGAAALSLAGFIKVRKGVAEAVEQLSAMGPAGEKAAAGLGKAASWAGKATIAFAALEVVGAVADAFGNASVNVDRLASSLQDYATTGKLTQGLTDEFGANLKDFGRVVTFADDATHGFGKALNGVASSIPGLGSLLDTVNEKLYGTSFNDATEKMKALDQAFSAFMATQKNATRAGEIWNQLLLKSGLDTDQLAKLLPNAYSALQKLQASSQAAAAGAKDLSGATGKTKAQLDAEAAAAKKTADELEALEKATEQAFGEQMNLDRAAIAAKDGMTQLRNELTHGTRTLDINTAEGRKNRSAVLDQLAAIEGLREARVRHGVQLDVANRKYLTDIDGLRKSMLQAGFTKKSVDALIGSYRKIPPKVDTRVSATGVDPTMIKLRALNIMQNALRRGVSLSPGAAAALAGDAKAAKDRHLYAGGGWTGPGAKWEPAGIVHADEQVIQKSSRRSLEAAKPGGLDYMNKTGRWPGYAGGGVVWPFPTTAAMTRIPSKAEAMSVVQPPVPTGGQTWRWIIQAARALVGAVRVISTVRPGARTLSGNTSYHALGRAVDFAPSLRLAKAWYTAYGSRTKEEITPWRTWDIHNGRPHYYSAAIHRQHSGGNAHVHIAMSRGGVITEPVTGIGVSGRTYSFAENGPEHVIPQRYITGAGTAPVAGNTTTINLSVALAAGANMREAGRQIGEQLGAYLKGGGSVVVRGKTVLSAS